MWIACTGPALTRIAKEKNIPAGPKDFGEGGRVTRFAFTNLRALRLFEMHATPVPDAVVLVRDTEDDPAVPAELHLVRAKHAWSFRTVIGHPKPEVESWILAGFIPGNQDETERHTAMHSHLGFDPCRQGHRMSHNHGDRTKRPKEVLDALTAGDGSRTRECYAATGLAALEANGAETGLPEFFDEVRTHLVPLF